MIVRAVIRQPGGDSPFAVYAITRHGLGIAARLAGTLGDADVYVSEKLLGAAQAIPELSRALTGGFNNYIGALRSRGLIEGDADRLMISEAGIRALGSWEPLPAGRALIDYWRGRLRKAERLIIETLTQAYPAALNKEEIAARAGYEANGGDFNNALGRVRTLELVQGRGELRASDDLFDRGA
jgi:hypothetical protein